MFQNLINAAKTYLNLTYSQELLDTTIENVLSNMNVDGRERIVQQVDISTFIYGSGQVDASFLTST